MAEQTPSEKEISSEEFIEALAFSLEKQAEMAEEKTTAKETVEEQTDPEEDLADNEFLETPIPWFFWWPHQELAEKGPFKFEGELHSNLTVQEKLSIGFQQLRAFEAFSAEESPIYDRVAENLRTADAGDREASDLTDQFFPESNVFDETLAEKQNPTDNFIVAASEEIIEKQPTEVLKQSEKRETPAVLPTHSAPLKEKEAKTFKVEGEKLKKPSGTDQKDLPITEPAKEPLFERPTGDDTVFVKSTPARQTTKEDLFHSVFKENPDVEFVSHEEPDFEPGPAIIPLHHLSSAPSNAERQRFVMVPETEWVAQAESFIADQIKLSQDTNGAENTSTARIQLTPEHLGELELEVNLQKNKLTVKLVVEQKETKKWLEQKVADLTMKLAEQNIEVADFQITVAPNDSVLVHPETQGNPFFEKQEQENKQKKRNAYSPKKEKNKETITQPIDSRLGRLSLWV